MVLALQFLLLICFAVPAWGQKGGWEEKWNGILAAARKEGKVVVGGNPVPDLRRDLPAAFRAKFGVPIEYIGRRGSQVVAQLRVERRAGFNTVDVMLTGMGTAAIILYPEKMLDPLKPVLILPEVVDPSKWKKGKLWFVDPEEEYVLRLLNYINPVLNINTRYVKPDGFKSIKDLLNPKWKGKISAFDPTLPGRGTNTAAFLYAQLGEGFVKRLYVDQKPIFSRSSRQIVDWLARGIYPISLDGGQARVKRMHREGFPVMNVYNLPDFPGSVTAGQGAVVLMNKAPHPNAARVFINWLASKEGLEVYARAHKHPTTRNDIDELSFLGSEEIPRPNVSYFDDSNWEFTVTQKEKVRWRMKAILGK